MSFDPNTPNPYAASSTQPTVPKKSNTLLYVLLGVGGILLLSCAGCGGFAWWGATSGMKMVGAVVGKQVTPQLQADPVIKKHIGNISEVEMSITDAISELSKNQARHAGRDIGLKIKGDKGSGLIMCRMDQSTPNQPRVVNGELLINGEYHKLSE